MKVWIDRLGDWNPQLLRELKGRLKPRNVLIAIGISLLTQFVTFQYVQMQIPIAPYDYQKEHWFCTGKVDPRPEYRDVDLECLKDALGNFIIDQQKVWLDAFVWLSWIGIFALLVAGTFMLIDDLATEQKRGNLNFIQLSPESTARLLIGKQMGVPVLLYLAAIIAVPLHAFAGLAAGISGVHILGFYGIVLASCVLFYSGSLLYGLITNWLGGFQAWLGGAVVLAFLFVTVGLSHSEFNHAFSWLRLFTPIDFIPNLQSSFHYRYGSHVNLAQFQWFYLPVGTSLVSFFGLAFLNYGLWTYWIWRGLKRCFRNPHATILSKRQSYVVTACFVTLGLGFALSKYSYSYSSQKEWLFQNVLSLAFFDLLLFLFLIAALTPHRQPLQDWARYRRDKVSTRKSFWKSSLVQDLIYADKSPALVAIALNLVIAILPLAGLILLTTINDKYDGTLGKINLFLSLGLAASIVMVYAAIAQILLFMKASNRVFWTVGTIGVLLFVPPMVLGVLGLQPGTTAGFLWYFTVFAPAVPLYPPADFAQTLMFVAILGQWTISGFTSWEFTKQLRKAGESASKALMSKA